MSISSVERDVADGSLGRGEPEHDRRPDSSSLSPSVEAGVALKLVRSLTRLSKWPAVVKRI